MSHDYGKDKNKKKPARRNQKNSGRQPLPGWVWFFSGVAVTLFAQLLVHLATVDAPAPAIATNTNAAGAEPAHKKPTINFYNQLKTMEVKVPGEETAPAPIQPVTGEKKETAETTTATAKTPDAPAKPAYSYALQAGSYKTAADADEQRAALSLLGVKANIETKANADGKTYYRLMVGPFTSATELEKARATLSNNSVPSITVKR